MKLYYHDNKTDDPRLPHHSGVDLSPTDLAALGIIFYSFPSSSPDSVSRMEEVAASRHYANRDEISAAKLRSSTGSDAYEHIMKTWYTEHMHEDEEIRYIVKGSGFFDVRDADDRWIRIMAEEGDFLILPAGIYHRFTVAESNNINVTRFFQSAPKWAALNRGEEAEANQYRKDYLLARDKGFIA